MPIEIREIVIKTTVESNASAQTSSALVTKEEKQALVQECIDQVMEILRENSER